MRKYLKITPEWILQGCSIGEDLQGDPAFIALITDFQQVRWVELALNTLSIKITGVGDYDDAIIYRIPLECIRATCPII